MSVTLSSAEVIDNGKVVRPAIYDLSETKTVITKITLSQVEDRIALLNSEIARWTAIKKEITG